jgi:hypothetical protein
MTSVPLEARLSYVVATLCGDGAFVWAVHERTRSYQASRGATGGLSGNIAPCRHAPAAVSAPVGLHLRPGQKGTKHLVEQYGDRSVCVRYRYDAARKKRIKTVELVVAESAWAPRFAPDEIVALRVAFTDVATRKRVKQAGGARNPDRTVWQLRYDRVVALGLRRRTVTLRHPVLDAAASSEEHPDTDAGPASTGGCE